MIECQRIIRWAIIFLPFTPKRNMQSIEGRDQIDATLSILSKQAI